MGQCEFMSHEELLQFLQCAPVDLFFKDTEGRYRYFSDAFTTERGSGRNALGLTDRELHADSAKAAHYWAEDQKILATGQGCEYLIEIPKPEGIRIYQVKKNPVYVEGKIIGIVGAFNDITRQVQMERKLRELSFQDPLTGLYNRTYLEVRAKPALKEAKLPITVVMADCNYLKKTNDTYGHEYGDLLLKRVARIIRSALPAGCTALRIGGDEFMILCEGCDEEQGKALVEDIRRRFVQETTDDRIPLSVAFGAHTTRAGEFSFSEAYRRADRAMYENKRKMRLAQPQ